MTVRTRNQAAEAVKEAESLLGLEETDAWFEYLEACRHGGDRTDEVEVWAWARLQQRLRAIRARRAALKRRAA